MNDLTERLRMLLADATPGDLSTAERHTENETFECPLCHEGEVEASDYCNIDGKALGVQFYGIGKEFGAHERLWSETLAALPDLLTTLETLTQENARLRLIVQVIADADSEDAVGSLDVDIPSGGYPRQWLRDAARKELGGEYADQR